MKFLKKILKFFTQSKEKPKEKIEEKKSSTAPKVEENKPAPEVPKVSEEIWVDLNKEFIKECSKWIGVREKGGQNKGPEVEMFQKAVDGKAQGEAYCMAFMQFCVMEIEKRFKVKSEIFKSEGVMETWNKSPAKLKHQDPKIGGIVCWNYVGSWTGHAGCVTDFDKSNIKTVEGNTGSGSAVIREGDGIYARTRSRAGTSKMVIKGYILPFPVGPQKIK